MVIGGGGGLTGKQYLNIVLFANPGKFINYRNREYRQKLVEDSGSLEELSSEGRQELKRKGRKRWRGKKGK